MDNIFNLYNRAYSEIGVLTPISADCGALCGAKCCKGDDNSGMIVFPGEERFLTARGYKLKRRDMAGYPVLFTACDGKCKRIYRPLSCRIFPLAPILENGALKIIEDPRAKYLCPLLSAHAVEDAFKDAVYRAFSILIEDEEVFKMLECYTKMIKSYSEFYGDI